MLFAKVLDAEDGNSDLVCNRFEQTNILVVAGVVAVHGACPYLLKCIDDNKICIRVFGDEHFDL